MIHRLFFAQNRMMGAPPGTYEVTFTVKEFFIDPDNAFADTEVGVLQYMTVKIGATEVLTNASGQAVFYLAAGTHTYEVYDNDRYLTTVKGEVTVVASAESVTAKVYPCLYKPTQVANMITPPAWAAGTYDEGWHVDYSGTIYVALLETSEEPGVGTDWSVTDKYIPVATNTEFDEIKNNQIRNMGAGTIWEADYAINNTKKYIQVSHIYFQNYNLTQTATGNSFVYDGNRLGLIGIGQTYEIRTVFNISGTSVIYRNIHLINSRGFLRSNSSSDDISNRRIGFLISQLSNGGLIENVIISGCEFTVEVVATTSTLNGRNGLLTGLSASTSIIREIYIQNSKIIHAARRAAILIGLNHGLVENCFVDNLCEVVANTMASGLCYENSGVIKDSYSASIVGGTSPSGFVGVNTGTITNCYYDKDTSGCTDTGKGNPRTTLQMKEGTADSFILPAGGNDPDSLVANAMYTSWDDVDTWDFGTTSDYPTLK